MSVFKDKVLLITGGTGWIIWQYGLKTVPGLRY